MPAASPGRAIDPLLAWAVAAIVLAAQLRLADGELMSPDAAGYLDIARRFWMHGSLATGYNPYQFWPGATHPFLPYVQPLYPILVGWTAVLGGIHAMIVANLVLFAAACGLVTALSAHFAGRVTAVLAGLLVGFSSIALSSAMHPWTEPLHLLVLLAAIAAFAHPRAPRVAVGAILGASALIRFAGVYNAFAHVRELVHVLGWGALLGLAALAALFGPLRREPVFTAFVVQGIAALFAISASFAWLEKIEPERYALVSFFTLVPAGLAALRFAARALAKPHPVAIEWGYGAAVALLFAWSLASWAGFMRVYGVGIPPEAEAFATERNQVAAWVREHSTPDELIASDLLQDPALTERSMVALPRGKQLDPEHALDEFLAVWSPRLILTGSGDVARMLAGERAYHPAVRSAHIYVLERTAPPPPPR